MKIRILIAILLITKLNGLSQTYKNPGELEFRSFKIGDEVNTTLFKKYRDLYFPNYLDGWTMANVQELPAKYKGLPIAIWQLKSDSSIALTLYKNVILNITISYLTEKEKQEIGDLLTERFGGPGKLKIYQQSHPLQSWITFWNLITWEKDGIIVQIGNSSMRMPDSPEPKKLHWNLVYSDLTKEKEVVDELRKR